MLFRSYAEQRQREQDEIHWNAQQRKDVSRVARGGRLCQRGAGVQRQQDKGSGKRPDGVAWHGRRGSGDDRTGRGF